MRNVIVLAAICLVAVAAQAAERQPLLQEGKKTLFQRVVTHPGAQIYAGPEDGAQVVKPNVKTFTVMYVYGRQGSRLEVGVASNAAEGWVEAASVTVWPQAITMLFTERTSRSPVLFFKDHDSLVATCTDEKLDARVRQFLDALRAGKSGQPVLQDLPVIAAEPSDEEGAVSRNRFYLMPVLQVDNQFQGTKLVEVASIDPGTGGGAKGVATGPLKPKNAQSQELSTAIAFVIDTTISMRPYIEQALTVVRNIYDALEKSPNKDKVAFAVVAFRNSTEASPGLEYTSKLVSDFKTVTDRESLEQALAAVREATSSSHSYDEDSMAGIKAAVDSLSWKNYASRVMLLVSDAGPLAGSDKYSSTHMDPSEVADYLRANNIWLTAMHVKSPKGQKNHPYAEKAYKSLARMSDGTVSYLAINAATPQSGAAQFEKVGKALATGYMGLVTATAEGKMLQKPAEQPKSEDPEEQARQLAQISGYAMQLEFLGSRRQNQAPGVVSAWISDTDLIALAGNVANPPLSAYPAVLLTKNQLSDLSKRLKIILDEATASMRLGSTGFFQSIISAAAQMTRDPSKFSSAPGLNLSQTGVLGEYLDGLPYTSDIISMTESDWYAKTVGEQTQIINKLRSRVARYDEYDKDRANWESFGSPNPGDWVYRVPLTALP
ncbi:VWA domain-containing protein [Desulfovibrio sulfodismutans]|uniref:VWA domain-containing protein n=1 Tax=Desulfolutivibrio sulfodismutans TaxID=63561 RepID=A0A7K3NLD6_9BACT|nr:VWA domain-containing protein [Desulfolutivibrio sulfodismutans]QLA14489.1 VWA domain-containing protein [Desulfolutivibrio sulfodismutans DSM 3696]